ncbi:unnamed protein product [Amoebophrya sp. A120]|nr:unnamed protein product [Amoebophrya sp. A120]|eukprot:GSA120T00020599001.1
MLLLFILLFPEQLSQAEFACFYTGEVALQQGSTRTTDVDNAEVEPWSLVILTNEEQRLERLKVGGTSKQVLKKRGARPELLFSTRPPRESVKRAVVLVMPKRPMTSKGVEGEQKRIMRRGGHNDGTRGTPSDDVLAEDEEEEARQARTFFAKEPGFLATWHIASGEDDNRSGATPSCSSTRFNEDYRRGFHKTQPGRRDGDDDETSPCWA